MRCNGSLPRLFLATAGSADDPVVMSSGSNKRRHRAVSWLFQPCNRMLLHVPERPNETLEFWKRRCAHGRMVRRSASVFPNDNYTLSHSVQAIKRQKKKRKKKTRIKMLSHKIRWCDKKDNDTCWKHVDPFWPIGKIVLMHVLLRVEFVKVSCIIYCTYTFHTTNFTLLFSFTLDSWYFEMYYDE